MRPAPFGMTLGPYITFVTFGRNDGYTPKYAERVSSATACLAHELDRAEIDSEIIICDWNSPSEHPLLLDVLRLPKVANHVSIRGIVVPPALHKQFSGSEERGIHAG